MLCVKGSFSWIGKLMKHDRSGLEIGKEKGMVKVTLNNNRGLSKSQSTKLQIEMSDHVLLII